MGYSQYGQHLHFVEPVFSFEDEMMDHVDTAQPSELIGYVHLVLNDRALQVRITQSIFGSIGSSLVILLLGIAGTLLLTKRISRPINDLIKATEAVANGQNIEKINIGSNKELKLLANSFNTMVAQLNKKSSKEIDPQKGHPLMTNYFLIFIVQINDKYCD